MLSRLGFLGGEMGFGPRVLSGLRKVLGGQIGFGFGNWVMGLGNWV